MKKSTIAVITLPLVLLSTIACNRGKAADSENNTDKTETVKIDSIKEKTVLIIDTLDYNKRMAALSNNDTVTIGNARTQQEAMTIISKSLCAQGLTAGSKEFQTKLDAAWAENKVKSLPVK